MTASGKTNGGRAKGQILLYLGVLAATCAAVVAAAFWLDISPRTSGVVVMAVTPFPLAVFPLFFRARRHAATARALAASLILGYGISTMSAPVLLFVPGALLMGAAALRAFFD